MTKFVVVVAVGTVLGGEAALLVHGSHGAWDVRLSLVLQLVKRKLIS